MDYRYVATWVGKRPHGFGIWRHGLGKRPHGFGIWRHGLGKRPHGFGIWRHGLGMWRHGLGKRPHGLGRSEYLWQIEPASLYYVHDEKLVIERLQIKG
jgi:hypothetical protein